MFGLHHSSKGEGRGMIAPAVEPHIDNGEMRFAYAIGNPLNVVSVVTKE